MRWQADSRSKSLMRTKESRRQLRKAIESADNKPTKIRIDGRTYIIEEVVLDTSDKGNFMGPTKKFLKSLLMYIKAWYLYLGTTLFIIRHKIAQCIRLIKKSLRRDR